VAAAINHMAARLTPFLQLGRRYGKRAPNKQCGLLLAETHSDFSEHVNEVIELSAKCKNPEAISG